MQMLAQALNNGASIELLERLMALSERFEATEARKQFESAMADAAKEMPVISKSIQVSFGAGRTSYRHADLAEVTAAVAPVLGRHGLSYRFETVTEPGRITVTCVVSHKGGHCIRNSLTGPPDTSGSKNLIQSMGSTITYLSRYSLMATLGLAAARDDDGAGAQYEYAVETVPAPPQQQSQSRARRPPPAPAPDPMADEAMQSAAGTYLKQIEGLDNMADGEKWVETMRSKVFELPDQMRSMVIEAYKERMKAVRLRARMQEQDPAAFEADEENATAKPSP
jgi:cell division septation protein DedD